MTPQPHRIWRDFRIMTEGEVFSLFLFLGYFYFWATFISVSERSKEAIAEDPR